MNYLFPTLLLATSLAVVSAPTPVQVKVHALGNGQYELLRGGQPYFVKGAGGSGYQYRLAAYGGNSLRTWTTQGADQVLDSARANGLTVMLGLDMARERHGFDYNDTAAVGQQLRRVRADVLKYKDDPAVLLWGIGNELNLDYSNPQVWNAVNEVARMIHQVDPNHPATTVLAGVAQKEIDYLKARCPDLDLLSINTYGGLPALPQQLRDYGWTGPYLVTEWGPTGHWEGPQTPWKASVEETSSQKAAVYRSRYEAAIAKDKGRCLGSYVFLWGQKQERTPTWYGVFTEDGHESEVVDVLHYLWTGRWPQNRAPHLAAFLLDGQKATDNVQLQPGRAYPVQTSVTDPDNDKLTYRYELLPESTDLGQGGDRESRPGPVAGALPGAPGPKMTLKTPTKTGAYRLFVYTTDSHNNVATANIPFFVR